MTTQSVKTQAVNVFGNTAGGANTKGKQAVSGFDLIIGNNMKMFKNKNTDVESATAKTANKSRDIADKTQNDDITAKQTEVVQKESSTDDTKSTNQADDTKKVSTVADETEDTKEVSEVDEQLIAQITGMLQSIQEAVMNTLNLSPEELNQLLEDQGMTITDLLQPENLQQLILANSGQDNILAVLTDENLANQMNDLLQQVEGIISEADLGLTKEQMDAILAQAKQKAEAETITDNVTVKVEGSEDDSDEQTNAVSRVDTSGDDSISAGDNTVKNATDSTQVTDTKNGSSSAQDDNPRHDKKDLNADDQFRNFVDNLVNTTKDAQVDFTGNMSQATQLREIANQIIDRIKVSVTVDQTSMELQLNPENLGKVNLTVQSKNGVMTAQFVVQNQLSKEAIESQIQTLRETLSAQGLKVEAIEVTVANYDFNPNGQEASQNQTDSQKNESGKKITMEEAMSMTEEAIEERTSEDTLGMTGSQIDYTA